ncbi:unnamed protein product [Ambrosiozyma monospora]|uniref:Unnamed protein product n=1 Tax=Ambrosiozyma monospora TaxID=43982 RepID=A0A9W7DE72_AMBMO|nr:unnamed protein product [Ambrosiozyma monospora]
MLKKITNYSPLEDFFPKKASGNESLTNNTTHQAQNTENADQQNLANGLATQDPFLNHKKTEYHDYNNDTNALHVDSTVKEKFQTNVLESGTWGKVYIGATCLSALLVFVLQAAIFGVYYNNFKYKDAVVKSEFDPLLPVYGYYNIYLETKHYSLVAYLMTFLLSSLFQVALVILCLYSRNRNQFSSSRFHLVCMIIFNAIQYDDLVNGFDMLAELRAILDKFLEISRPMSTIKD